MFKLSFRFRVERIFINNPRLHSFIPINVFVPFRVMFHLFIHSNGILPLYKNHIIDDGKLATANSIVVYSVVTKLTLQLQ